jgi:hypothetical protein
MRVSYTQHFGIGTQICRSGSGAPTAARSGKGAPLADDAFTNRQLSNGKPAIGIYRRAWWRGAA